MAVSSKKYYDAIIIGAGMSGLVCASHLAKAGMKVIVVEQQNKPGGYCNFQFDAAVHSFGWAVWLWQLFDPDLWQKSFLDKLDSTRHWLTQPHGTPGVMYLGYSSGKLVLQQEIMKKRELAIVENN